MPPTAPPDHLLWRNVAEWPLPPTEGNRDLLVWQGFTMRIYTPNEPTSTGSWGWSSCDPRGVLLPGDRPASLWWTWADGDPWTRRSPADRADEKLIFFARGYSATTETIQGLLFDRQPLQQLLPLPAAR